MTLFHCVISLHIMLQHAKFLSNSSHLVGAKLLFHACQTLHFFLESSKEI